MAACAHVREIDEDGHHTPGPPDLLMVRVVGVVGRISRRRVGGDLDCVLSRVVLHPY